MKKLFILLFAIILSACKAEPKIDYAIISGKIANSNVLSDLTLNDMNRTFEEKLKVSSDGTFLDTLSTDINSYVLYDGTNPVFLHIKNGDHLIINYDFKDFKNTLSITGKGSEVSNYLVQKRKVEKENFGDSKTTYSLEENNFKEKIKSIKKGQDSILNSIEGISDDFRSKEIRNTHYFYLRLLTDYEGGHKHFTKKTDFKVSDNFLSELNDLDYQNEEDYKFSNYYRALLDEHFKNKARELSKKDSIKSDDVYFKILDSVQNEVVRNGLLFEYANSDMNYSKNIEAFYNNYISRSTDEKNKTTITEKYNKLTALLEGNPSPKFIDYKNYDGSTSSLDDLKGKYVYIDVWATWCGPCIREIPSLKKVEQQYHDKNIEFVSISIDKTSDFEKWKTMVADKELGGIQLFADNDWKSQFVKDYQINGIPRFILIGPDGNIVDSNAPRPSSPKLIEVFNELKI